MDHFSFTFKKDTENIPIAEVVGGKKDGKTLSVTTNNKEGGKKNKEYVKMIDEDTLKKITKKYKSKDIKKAIEKLAKNVETGGKEKNNNKVELNNGKFEPAVDKKHRQSFYVSGSNGSGKSTWISLYLKRFRKAFKDSDILLFSQKEHDEKLDKYHPIRILLNEKLITSPLSLNDFKPNTLLIFDDVDSISNKKLQKAVDDLVDLVLKVGRSSKIYCIISSHMLSNYKQTRHFINESDYVVLFPNFGSPHFVMSFMKKYLGLTPKQIKYLRNVNSRWIAFRKIVPLLYFAEKEAQFINSLDE